MTIGFRKIFILTTAIAMAVATGAVRAASSIMSPGDVVRISVYGLPDLGTTTRVSQDGRITFPLIGDVIIGGLTTAEAERDIAIKLDRGGFVKNAQVSVFVEERSEALASSVTILGQVQRSGKYPLQEDSVDGVRTLVDLLAAAGGPGSNAADHLLLLRKQGDERRKVRVDLVALLRDGDMDTDITLTDKDIVVVPEMEVFYIYGQVQRPGRYRLERNMTVMQALSVASGVTDRGSENGVVLNRRGDKGMQTIKSELDGELKPNDVIYVKDSFF